MSNALPDRKERMSRISSRAAMLVIIAASIAAYANSVWNGFVHDDFFQLVNNPWVRDVSKLPSVFMHDVWAFREAVPSNYYRPMMYALYMAEYKMFGLSPWGYHLVSILLNAAVSALVFFAVKTTLGQWSKTEEDPVVVSAALYGGLVFALHPVHTEVVSWVACAPELLFMLFGLAAFCLYTRGGAGAYCLSAVFFLLALFSKETAAAFLPAVIAYDYCIRGKIRPLKYAAYAAVFFLYFALRTKALTGVAPDVRRADLTGYEVIINAFPLFAGYIWKLVLPVNLNAFHILHPVRSALEFKAFASMFFAAGYAVLIFVSKGPWRFGLILSALPLFPVLYIPALGENAFAERYLYMPTFGFALIAAYGILKAESSGAGRKAVLAIVAAVLVLYLAGTFVRNPVWKDSLTLWRDTVQKSPDGALPHNEYGIALYREGMLSEAAVEFEASIRIDPWRHFSHNNLGTAYYRLGRVSDAAREFETAIGILPGYIDAHRNLGTAYLSMGMKAEAEAEFREAERIMAGLSRKR